MHFKAPCKEAIVNENNLLLQREYSLANQFLQVYILSTEVS